MRPKPFPRQRGRREAKQCRIPVAYKGYPCTLTGVESDKAVPAFCLDGDNLKEVPKHGGAGNRVKITLRCSECKQRNYNTTRTRRTPPDRLELNKYCPFCRKHTVHNETK